MSKIVYLVAPWFAGIALAKVIHPPWQALLLLGLIAILFLVLCWQEIRIRWAAGCVLVLVLGAGRFVYDLPRFDETFLATYNDVGWVVLEGVVVSEPDEREHHTNLRVKAEQLTLPNGTELEIEGMVLIGVESYPQRHYGDRIRVEGLLETPPVLENFSYKDYLARQDIYSLIQRAQITFLAENQAERWRYYLFTFKRYAQSTIARILPEPQAALLTGILLGIETGIPSDLMDDFSATGTTHIIAISGFNLTIVANLLANLAQQFFNKRRAVLVAAAGVAIYTVFVGASAAVVRAAAMSFLYLGGLYLGRPTSAFTSLGWAAFFMTWHDPNVLWDVGFGLSFTATAGLMIYTGSLENVFERVLTRFTSVERARKIVRLISESFLVTLAAQILTLPIIMTKFGRLSLITLVTNVGILWIQSYIMVVGSVATLLGLVILPLGQVVGWVVWAFLAYTILIVQSTAKVPFASVEVQMEWWMMWGCYLLIGGVTWWMKQPQEWRHEWWSKNLSRLKLKVIFASILVLMMLMVFTGRTLPDDDLHITLLDVGQGDAIFIRTPSGKQILVDGGPSETVLLSQLGDQMPFWDHTLDMMILSHPDADHITGLVPVLERYQVDTVIFREVEHRTEVYEYWQQLLQSEGAMVYQGEVGLHITLDQGLEMTVLHPGVEPVSGTDADVNNNSVAVRLVHGQVSVLLTGDIEAVVERQLVATGTPLASRVLKAAHHGSCSSTTQRFLDAVNPEIVVISVGADNDFGHPCPDVMERLEGLPVYRTDEQGVVEIISDGVGVWVETER
ncbi:MAG: DNA internalization-related competence protein ComEC/Rec2 [Chloroflexi bacterium]|nr:DNA internalization-related competence protein ComEC/Rec2 [Chloroflexota bacterium]